MKPGREILPERRIDPALCLLAVAVALACWWPTRALPVHWDAVVPLERARQIRDSHFTELTVPTADFAHPPLVPILLAVALSVCGDELLPLHVVLAWALPVAVVCTYLIGRQVAGRLVGATAAAVMLAAPVTLEETGQLYLDLPLCAFVSLGVWAWLVRREALAGVAFGLAVMTKLPGLMVPVTLLAFQVLDPSRRRSWRMYVTLTTPFLLTAAWLVHHEKETGWLISRPGRIAERLTDPTTLARDAVSVGYWLFGTQGRGLVMALAAIASAVILARRLRGRADKAAPRPSLDLLALGAIPLVALGAFTAFGEVTERYGLFVFPCFFVAAFALVRLASLSSRWWPAVTALAVPVAGLAVLTVEMIQLHPQRKIETAFDFRPDEDLGARDMIAVGQKAARWTQEGYPAAHVYGAFPESYQLTEPRNGYLDVPLWFSSCDTYGAEPSPSGAPAVTELVFIHRYAPGQIACKQLADARHARALKLFVVNGHWIEIRQL